MYRIYHTGLPKEQLKKIKNREYTHDEIEYLYQWIYRHYQAKQRAWIIAIIMVGVILIVVGLLGLLKVDEKVMLIYLGAMLVTTLMCVLICIYVKINMVNKDIKQFQKALSVGYPELYERIVS